MANYVADKYLTTARDAYRHPYREHTSYKYYCPQLFFAGNSSDHRPNQGTKAWFQDYRRPVIAEKTLCKNLITMQSPLRPTDFSDKPDIALGERKIHREALFPVIYNQPLYQLTIHHHDSAENKRKFRENVYNHRSQYKDLTGSLHKKVDEFYQPIPARDAFEVRHVSKDYITDFPGHHTAASEYVTKRREKSNVDYAKLDVCI